MVSSTSGAFSPVIVIGSNDSAAAGEEESGTAMVVEKNARKMPDINECISGMIVVGESVR